MKSISLFLLIVVSLCLSIPAFADSAFRAGVKKTKFEAYDDWPADALLSEGTTTCVGGDLEWIDPVTPYCATGDIRIRDTVLYACVTSEEARSNGVAAVVVNGNLDFTYGGPVWGKITLVPSDDCNPLDEQDNPVETYP